MVGEYGTGDSKCGHWRGGKEKKRKGFVPTNDLILSDREWRGFDSSNYDINRYLPG